jgi:hypothetical protein
MKKLSLRPYHGQVWVCDTLDELRKAYKRVIGKPYPYGDDDPNGGRFVLTEGDSLGDRIFLVYGKQPHCLAHELTHVLLIVFKTIGHDPREGDGEPFCYMLSQLMLESK